MRDVLEHVLRRIIELLAVNDYYSIESLTGGVRLSASEIEQAIREYGGKVIVPPSAAFAFLDSIEVVNAKPRAWSVTMPLWTEEEGRSDLSVEMTIAITDGAVSRIELDNIHVR